MVRNTPVRGTRSRSAAQNANQLKNKNRNKQNVVNKTVVEVIIKPEVQAQQTQAPMVRPFFF